jgi:hypothetical protein
MKTQKEDKLFALYPKLFPNGRKVDPMLSLMCFGFECDDGWYKLIKKLCKDITATGDKCTVVQVKEKFGGLRFYIEAGSSKVYELISKAESDSFKICEVCGKPGKVEGTGWFKTVCKKHKNGR